MDRRKHWFEHSFYNCKHFIVGVDAVVNSLAGEKLHASVDILAENGHFLEIGKYDLSQNNKLGMIFAEQRTTLAYIIHVFSNFL